MWYCDEGLWYDICGCLVAAVAVVKGGARLLEDTFTHALGRVALVMR